VDSLICGHSIGTGGDLAAAVAVGTGGTAGDLALAAAAVNAGTAAHPLSITTVTGGLTIGGKISGGTVHVAMSGLLLTTKRRQRCSAFIQARSGW
jgi:hypothetical protein